MDQFTQAQPLLHDKIEDLENCSRMNNLRIMGLPETYKHTSLDLDIYVTHIPEVLGLHFKCVPERAHRKVR